MKFRKLRIAWSAFCGLACILLLVLWLRSYWLFDQFIHRVSATDYVAFTTFQGQFALGTGNEPLLQQCFTQPWTRRGFRTLEWQASIEGPVAFFPSTPSPHDGNLIHWPRYGTLGRGYAELLIPYWLPCLAAATLSISPWLKYSNRFSLRTLLIVTTLIAVVLGLAVWTTR